MDCTTHAEKTGRVEAKVDAVYDLLYQFTQKADTKYATKDELAPLKLVVYGAIKLVLVAVGTALLTNVVGAKEITSWLPL